MAVMNTVSGRPPGRRGRYPKEFRRDAAALVIDQHRSVADVARELSVVEQTLGNWVAPGANRSRRERGNDERSASRERPAESRVAPGAHGA